jgi:hypothetical protein
LKHLLLVLFLVACSQTQVQNPPTTPSEPPVVVVPGEPSTIKSLWPNKELDSMAKKAIITHGTVILSKLPTDYVNWCPKFKDYSTVEKLDYWSAAISVMSKYESNFRTGLTYKEPFTDQTGKNVISRGLLQVSIESCRGYGMKLNNAEELHQPEKNLECGVRIINRWLERDSRYIGKENQSWRGSSRYWSVLKDTHNVHQKLMADLKKLCV